MTNMRKRLTAFLTAAACLTGSLRAMTANADSISNFASYSSAIDHRDAVIMVEASDIDAQLVVISRDDGGTYWILGIHELLQGGLSSFDDEQLARCLGDDTPLEPGDVLHVEGSLWVLESYPGIWWPKENCKITKLGNTRDLVGVEYTAPIVGDVNDDGKIDILDCIAVNKQLLGSDETSKDTMYYTDVNKDGVLDASDSLAILKEVVGLTENFEEVKSES